MLKTIQIRDFAIVDAVELELNSGMTALTGETGAGKSILVDALGLALGDRADSQTVRDGAKRAEVTAQFDLSGNARVAAWLEERDLDEEDECVVRRVVGADGRSRAYVNGHGVALHVLRDLGEQMVDIHGQHEHQSLTRPAVQRDLVDFHGNCRDLIGEVAGAYRAWKVLRDAFDTLASERDDREARLELLRYQVRELDALDINAEEWEELQEEQRMLANRGRLSDGAREALDALYDAESGSAQQSLGRAGRSLEDLVEIDQRLAESRALVVEAEIQINEAANSLRRYLTDLDMDPARQVQVDDRIGDIQDLARKHRVEPAELGEHLESLRTQLEEIENADVRFEDLTKELESAESDYLGAAARLTAARRKGAKDMGKQISSAMQQLGMPGGVLSIEVKTPKEPGPGNFHPSGLDSMEFLVSANPGQAPRGLGKVASGGELSRISLSVQVIAAGGNSLSCMVFDEVDAGVGGGVAEIVGRRLAELAQARQVLCVTHLPQVASQADHHVRVAKLTDGRTTRTTLAELNGAEKVEELARMLGGVEITARTRQHAAEMIARAGKA